MSSLMNSYSSISSFPTHRYISSTYEFVNSCYKFIITCFNSPDEIDPFPSLSNVPKARLNYVFGSGLRMILHMPICVHLHEVEKLITVYTAIGVLINLADQLVNHSLTEIFPQSSHDYPQFLLRNHTIPVIVELLKD